MDYDDEFFDPENVSPYADYTFVDSREPAPMYSQSIMNPTSTTVSPTLSPTLITTTPPVTCFNANYTYSTGVTYEDINNSNNNNNYYATMSQPTAAPSPVNQYFTADDVYQYMVNLSNTDVQTFTMLLSAINSINAPTTFVNDTTTVANEEASSSTATAAMTDSNITDSSAADKAVVFSPVLVSCSCDHSNSNGAHSHTKSIFTSKKVTKDVTARSKIAKKFYAVGDGEEYYECTFCNEKRSSNTFASEGHHHDAEYKIRWFCPMCSKSTAVTYRTAHLRTRHGIEKLNSK